MPLWHPDSEKFDEQFPAPQQHDPTAMGNRRAAAAICYLLACHADEPKYNPQHPLWKQGQGKAKVKPSDFWLLVGREELSCIMRSDLRRVSR